MPELLLELFSEEIPARMQARAAADLEKSVNQRLMDAGYMPEGVKAFATPRRLAVTATGLPPAQPDRREEKKGPRKGAPDKAIEGFLKSAGLDSLDQCEEREDKKGAYYVAVIDEKGRPTADVVADFTPEIVRGFNWPKSMRWGDGDMRWVRPLHSILCAFDGEIVDFKIGDIQSSDKTHGHRFMAPDEIQARNFEDYAAALRKANVVLDSTERAHTIAGEAKILCEAQGLELVEDKGLLTEVAGLAEWPVVMIGSFDEKFLTLPDEVLTASMRGHQKYFSVRDPKTGRLANKFIFVANIEATDGGKAMRVGYERVLTARLSDGWFLYHEDLKRPLKDRIEGLDRITFFEGLGTVGDKARRVAALAKEIAEKVGADPQAAEQAALLAKADLVTGMVGEFPELQGVMGRYYALQQGESAETADAIRDHYKPVGQDDGVPTAPVSVAVALADKIDTLTAFWAIDQKPTGSKDPFALRRAALGVIEIILRQNHQMDLRDFVGSILYAIIRENAPIRSYEQFIDLPTQEDELYGAATTLPDPFKPPYTMIIGHSGFYDSSLGKIEMYRHGSPDIDYPGDPYEDLPTEIAKELDSRNAAFEEFRKRLMALSNISSPFDVYESEKTRYEQLFEINDVLPDALLLPLNELFTGLLAFFHDRLKVYLRGKNHRHDHIDAVLTDGAGNLQDDLVLIVAKLKALETFLKTDDGANLVAGYKRAANILKAEGKKGDLPGGDAVVPQKFSESKEKVLFGSLEDAEAAVALALEKEDFASAMAALAELRGPIDAFFEDVTVNADDPALRANRLALLQRFLAATATVADFSKLEG